MIFQITVKQGHGFKCCRFVYPVPYKITLFSVLIEFQMHFYISRSFPRFLCTVVSESTSKNKGRGQSPHILEAVYVHMYAFSILVHQQWQGGSNEPIITKRQK